MWLLLIHLSFSSTSPRPDSPWKIYSNGYHPFPKCEIKAPSGSPRGREKTIRTAKPSLSFSFEFFKSLRFMVLWELNQNYSVKTQKLKNLKTYQLKKQWLIN